ncbi:MAG: Mg2+ transporter-C (MgtC) family protein [Parcubacteria group bacterium GW2011_GWC1_45_13]|uniref:Mg2+ transporter-C (MgtC) family protein n=2 Tax=Candidatus Giovannoniibacteriota TaxID=1752738 RepID=A0A0G1LWD0_9BACT|nr:MAG: Mg2+ transporter-C (MgtC) family protein [Candidatus Giovannonibacteria bacterium GW2011_GWB1_44_23]KKT64059.1 MAG: Mg2+ transporter-C (MgtC) family protein [Candidatus Giovannonibacteria bacterium GW2011_GWA1_44_29]KKT91907.1 MAG: Mg2+ transporter-C (MgtC) family protein [Parcubacteria group bacterium GW2011_GWC1_45_13]
MYNDFLTPEIIWMIKQLTLAAVLGMAIGFEREHRRKPAGLRTYTLVAIGAALFTILSSASVLGTAFDPARIAANIVVGIGFIGGGLIFMKGEHMEGLTTAAGLWATAAIGMAAGFGLYAIAVYATILTLLVLWALRSLENKIHQGEGPS